MSADKNEQLTSLAMFENHTIRQIWSNGEWFFSVVDMIAALTENTDPLQYWSRFKKRTKRYRGIDLASLCISLELLDADGSPCITDCASTKNMLCIVQYVPTPRANPFREWLAQEGAARLQKGRQVAHKGDLRSGMTALELAVITFAENVSTALHIERDSQGFAAVARDVSDASGLARENRLKLEEMTGQPVVSATNMQVERDGGLWSLLPPPADA